MMIDLPPSELGMSTERIGLRVPSGAPGTCPSCGTTLDRRTNGYAICLQQNGGCGRTFSVELHSRM